jgi:hypothetical protein
LRLAHEDLDARETRVVVSSYFVADRPRRRVDRVRRVGADGLARVQGRS